jgi:anti-sigma factor ChrR (cupin superfamily)
MSESVKPNALLSAEFALGLVRGEDRRALAARLATDETLQSEVETWQRALAELDELEAAEVAAQEAPPPGLFEAILGHIDAEGLQLPGTKTSRAEAAVWHDIAPGIRARVLNIDRANNRQSLLLKMAAGAIYYPHKHDADEESLILEGDLTFGDLRLGPGDYHRATAPSQHPVGRTEGGCLVHVVTSLSH